MANASAVYDRVFLSNDYAYSQNAQPGAKYDTTFNHSNTLVNETSAHGSSAAVQELFIATQNGRIIDCQVGVVTPATSASGFVSGTVQANIRINSVSIMSTVPQIQMAYSASAVGRLYTGGGAQNASAVASTLISGVVNAASAYFSTGDQISFDWAAFSAGSAAPGAAGKGMYVATTVRYQAI